MTRVSIITPTLNGASYLPEALSSIRAQNYSALEHLVVDGGSTDKTVEIARAEPGVQLIDGHDRGIYDALNRGIVRSHGSVVGFLNSDDRLAPQVIQRVAGLFEENPDLDLVTGFCIAFETEGVHAIARYDDATRLQLSARNAMLEVPVINARFFRRAFLELVGPFSMKYPLAADREFLIRAAMSHPKQVVLPLVVYEYRVHSGSKTLDPLRRRAQQLAEENMTMAEDMASQAEIWKSEGGALLRWHAEYSLTGMYSALLRRDLKGCIGNMARGQRFSGGWPLAASQALVRKMLGRMQ